MVRLRLKRTGRTHRPYYRIVAVDVRSRRDSAPIEEIGLYDPFEQDAEKAVVFKPDRAAHWLDAGAAALADGCQPPEEGRHKQDCRRPVRRFEGREVHRGRCPQAGRLNSTWTLLRRCGCEYRVPCGSTC